MKVKKKIQFISFIFICLFLLGVTNNYSIIAKDIGTKTKGGITFIVETDSSNPPDESSLLKPPVLSDLSRPSDTSELPDPSKTSGFLPQTGEAIFSLFILGIGILLVVISIISTKKKNTISK